RPYTTLFRSLAVYASGQAVVAGSTLSTDFPFGPGFRSSNAGGTDGFVTKLSASGSMILYSTYLGGSGLDVPTALAMDTSGAAYVAGRTASTDFPLKGEFQSSLRGIQDAFVSKLAASGAELVYSTYLGGSDVDGANGIAVDAAGQAVVAGFTQSINFPTASAFQAARGGT